MRKLAILFMGLMVISCGLTPTPQSMNERMRQPKLVIEDVAQRKGHKYIFLEGLIKNEGTATAEFVRVEARMYKANALFQIEDTYTRPSTIQPGQSVSFTLFTDPGWDRYELVIRWGR